MEEEKELLEEEKEDFWHFNTKEIEENVEEDSIYSEEVREEMVEDDEISPGEAGFMMGYDEAYT